MQAMSSGEAVQNDSKANVVHDACHLLQSTLSALVADAASLRQLAAVRRTVASNDKGAADKVRQQLRRLDRVVTELEDKMQIFRDVVQEERKAIVEIEKLTEATKAQVEAFRDLPGKVAQSEIGMNRQEMNKSKDSPQRDTQWKEKYFMTGDTREDDDNFQDGVSNDDGNEWNDDDNDYPRNNHAVDGKQKETDPYYNYTHSDKNLFQHFVKLDLVTNEEFLSVPRATRSHISRALVNEAILDLERMFQEKEIQRLKDQRKRALLTWNNTSDDDDDVLTCTEQEMRQSCAFFRSGESSARAVLMILRYLHRIKQIPAKHGSILYALP